MDYYIFVNTVNQIKKFPRKMEFITLMSIGEPFLNKHLADMIAYLKKADIAKEIAINTNATLLNNDINKAIVDAGLDSIRISIQGVNAEQYKKVCGVNVDFDSMVSNIKNLYEQKGNLDIYVKIIDVDLTVEDRNIFTETFLPICDSLFIENPVDSWVKADLDMKFKDTRYGYETKRVMVCPRIFFAMVVHYDGSVVACNHDWEATYPLGNISEKTLVDIWNGEKFYALRKAHLSLEG